MGGHVGEAALQVIGRALAWGLRLVFTLDNDVDGDVAFAAWDRDVEALGVRGPLSWWDDDDLVAFTLSGPPVGQFQVADVGAWHVDHDVLRARGDHNLLRGAWFRGDLDGWRGVLTCRGWRGVATDGDNGWAGDGLAVWVGDLYRDDDLLAWLGVGRWRDGDGAAVVDGDAPAFRRLPAVDDLEGRAVRLRAWRHDNGDAALGTARVVVDWWLAFGGVGVVNNQDGCWARDLLAAWVGDVDWDDGVVAGLGVGRRGGGDGAVLADGDLPALRRLVFRRDDEGGAARRAWRRVDGHGLVRLGLLRGVVLVRGGRGGRVRVDGCGRVVDDGHDDWARDGVAVRVGDLHVNHAEVAWLGVGRRGDVRDTGVFVDVDGPAFRDVLLLDNVGGALGTALRGDDYDGARLGRLRWELDVVGALGGVVDNYDDCWASDRGTIRVGDLDRHDNAVAWLGIGRRGGGDGAVLADGDLPALRCLVGVVDGERGALRRISAELWGAHGDLDTWAGGFRQVVRVRVLCLRRRADDDGARYDLGGAVWEGHLNVDGLRFAVAGVRRRRCGDFAGALIDAHRPITELLVRGDLEGRVGRQLLVTDLRQRHCNGWAGNHHVVARGVLLRQGRVNADHGLQHVVGSVWVGGLDLHGHGIFQARAHRRGDLERVAALFQSDVPWAGLAAWGSADDLEGGAVRVLRAARLQRDGCRLARGGLLVAVAWGPLLGLELERFADLGVVLVLLQVELVGAVARGGVYLNLEYLRLLVVDFAGPADRQGDMHAAILIDARIRALDSLTVSRHDSNHTSVIFSSTVGDLDVRRKLLAVRGDNRHLVLSRLQREALRVLCRDRQQVNLGDVAGFEAQAVREVLVAVAYASGDPRERACLVFLDVLHVLEGDLRGHHRGAFRKVQLDRLNVRGAGDLQVHIGGATLAGTHRSWDSLPYRHRRKGEGLLEIRDAGLVHAQLGNHRVHSVLAVAVEADPVVHLNLALLVDNAGARLKRALVRRSHGTNVLVREQGVRAQHVVASVLFGALRVHLWHHERGRPQRQRHHSG